MARRAIPSKTERTVASATPLSHAVESVFVKSCRAVDYGLFTASAQMDFFWKSEWMAPAVLGIFNRHFVDYCTGGDTPKPSRWVD
jgi:hypothetical protein